MITLDSIIDRDKKIDLIKMDIQGSEMLALLGMKRTLWKYVNEKNTTLEEFEKKDKYELSIQNSLITLNAKDAFLENRNCQGGNIPSRSSQTS